MTHPIRIKVVREEQVDQHLDVKVLYDLTVEDGLEQAEIIYKAVEDGSKVNRQIDNKTNVPLSDIPNDVVEEAIYRLEEYSKGLSEQFHSGDVMDN